MQKPNSLLTPEQEEILGYEGDLTLEALSVLDTYAKECCNISSTSKKVNKHYLRVRRYLQQPYVREIFKLKLLEKGITPEKIANDIKAGLEASNGVYYEGGKCADEPNWTARHKFLQLAAEVFEVLKYNNKVDVTVSNTITMKPEEQKSRIERLIRLSKSININDLSKEDGENESRT